MTELHPDDRKNFSSARSEKDITRVSGTLSTGSIPVGRANVFSYLDTSREKVSAKVRFSERPRVNFASQHKRVKAHRRHSEYTSRIEETNLTGQKGPLVNPHERERHQHAGVAAVGSAGGVFSLVRLPWAHNLTDFSPRRGGLDALRWKWNARR